MQTFYMTVGLPGSGKSYLAKSIPNAVVHSSDEIRAEILGDINDQTKQEQVFDILHERVLNDLMAGKDVVYDATNISYKRRFGFLCQVQALHRPDIRTVCLFMAVPYESCVANNSKRDRVVPEAVIRKMYLRFDVPMMTEGWDEIRIIHDDEWGVSRPWSKYLLDETIKRLSKIEHENPYHQFSIGQHCLATWMYLRNHYPDADVTLQRATILHDIGKEKTKVFIDSKGNPTDVAHYYQHERVGAYDSFFYTRDLSHDQRLNVSLLIRWHMMPYVINRSDNPSKTTAKAKRLLGDDIWNQVMVLNDCDRNAH